MGTCLGGDLDGVQNNLDWVRPRIVYVRSGIVANGMRQATVGIK